MFVHDFVHIDRPPDAVKAAVLADRGRWLRPLATGGGDDQRLRVGPPGLPRDRPLLGKQVRVELGEPHVKGDHVVVPIRWEATGAPHLFPTLDAHLEITPLGTNATRIGLSGHYDAPLGAIGRTIDDLFLHALAEDTLRQFLQRLGRALEEQPESGP